MKSTMDSTRVGAGPARSGNDRPEWRTFAACRGVATLFYKSDLDSDELTQHRVTKAKMLCARCPVRPQCAAYALTMAEPYGIWGGFTDCGPRSTPPHPPIGTQTGSGGHREAFDHRRGG